MIDLDALADRYVTEFAELDPCMAALMGVAGVDDRLTDYSPDGHAARADLARRTLAALRSVPETPETPQTPATPEISDRERVAARMLRERLEVDLERDAAGLPDAHLSTIDGPVQRLRHAVEVLDRGPQTPWEDVHARIAGLPAVLAGLRTSLERARDEGRVAARRQVAGNIPQCEQLGAYLRRLASRHEGPLRDDLDRAVTAAETALAGPDGLARFLREDLAPYAPERDGVGREVYALEVRNHLGMRLDLEETYAWGWEELARLEAEMRATAERIAPGEPLAAVQAKLDADPAHRVAGADAFIAWLQDKVEAVIAELDGTHFDIPAPLRRIRCRTPATPGGIYYLAPAEDGSRPGTIYWTVPEDGSDIVTWAAPATLYHEGVPGHHLQLGTVVGNAGLNRFQRMSCELHPGHVEGWALYAERLMAELGLYDDPAHYLGMLAGGQQIRAARVILDIGMHLRLPIPAGTGFHEGERWTRDLGWEFLRAHSGPETDATVSYEIDRYLGMPGQAIAYKVGERVWLAVRDGARRAAQAAGRRFDLKEFHRRALDLGPMGLDLLTAELTRT